VTVCLSVIQSLPLLLIPGELVAKDLNVFCLRCVLLLLLRFIVIGHSFAFIVAGAIVAAVGCAIVSPDARPDDFNDAVANILQLPKSTLWGAGPYDVDCFYSDF